MKNNTKKIMEINRYNELLVSMERYFIEKDVFLTFDEIEGLHTIGFGIEFTPLNKCSFGFSEEKRAEILKSYGFQNATELGDDFRKRIMKNYSPTPKNYEKDELGYVYLLIYATNKEHNMKHTFALISHYGETSVGYYDLQNDIGMEMYNSHYEYFAQAKAYQSLDAYIIDENCNKIGRYRDILAWETLEKLIEILYHEMKDQLDTDFSDLNIKQPKPDKNEATKEDLEEFLDYFEIENEIIEENIDELWLSLQDFKLNFEIDKENEMYDFIYKVNRAYKVVDFIQNYSPWVSYGDWKFEKEDLIYHIENVTGLEDFDFEVPEETCSADLLPYARENLENEGYWLCNLDTGDDSYLFVAFKIENMPKVMNLAYKLGIPLMDFFR